MNCGANSKRRAPKDGCSASASSAASSPVSPGRRCWRSPRRAFSAGPRRRRILLRIDAFGKIIAELGFPPGGQSQHSFVRQILADYLGVALEDVQVITVDSLSMQPSTGPISSSMAIALSGAVLGAAARLTDKLKRAAAVMLEASADDVELFDGQFLVRGVPGKSLA